MSLEVHADLGPCSRRHMDIGDWSPEEDPRQHLCAQVATEALGVEEIT